LHDARPRPVNSIVGRLNSQPKKFSFAIWNNFPLQRKATKMSGPVTRTFEDQLVRILLFLLLFSVGVAQLFFVHEIRKKLFRLRHYLEGIYEQHPLLLRLFGPPLKNTTLRGYTVMKRIGGAILIIMSIVFLISAFQSPDPCDYHYWSITQREDPC
jgi:hypothetical protein